MTPKYRVRADGKMQDEVVGNRYEHTHLLNNID